MIINNKKLLKTAYAKKYAIPHFNINNLEILQSIIFACEKLKSPAILATSEGAIDYAGHEILFSLIKNMAQKSKIPFSIHLDHGKNFETIKKCIKFGYTSIMFDGSHYNFENNIRLTKKVVNLCSKKNISVEGELGTIGGAEDKVRAKKIILTEPYSAKEFVEKTGVDSLAVAIGTSHGAYKFKNTPQLDIKRLKEINKQCKIPLVLHGASEVPRQLVNLANKYGANLKHLSGVPQKQLKQAIKNGISKVNTDTDLRLAFTAGIRKFLSMNKADFDPRHTLNEAKNQMQTVVENRIKELGSANKI